MKRICHCFQKITFKSSCGSVVHCSSGAFFTLVWWIQGFISANLTNFVGVVKSMSQGSVHFPSSWLSGDAVIYVLRSTSSPGSKECSKRESPKVQPSGVTRIWNRKSGRLCCLSLPEPVSRDRDWIFMALYSDGQWSEKMMGLHPNRYF